MNFLSNCNSCYFVLALKAALAVSSLLIVAYIFKVWRSYSYFKKRGIKTPPYEFFYGNFRTIDKSRYSDVLSGWTKMLGKTYGYYEGHMPILVTSDLDMIQQIFVKQYANFAARKKNFISRSEDNEKIGLFSASKLRWKRMRNIMNPTFSTSKLREVSPAIKKCVDRMVKALDSEKDKKTNVIFFFKRFTMDTIWNTAFGVDIDVQNKRDNDYFKNCEMLFSSVTLNYDLIRYIGCYFCELREFLFVFQGLLFTIGNKISKSLFFNPFFWLFDSVSEIVDKRKSQPEIKKRDFVQLLLDAEAFNNSSQNKSDNSESDGQIDPSMIHVVKRLTLNEVKSNLIGFMLAGYETTSTTLSYCAYVLSKHPQEQQRLYDEISSVFDSDFNLDEIDSDSVLKLEYLDMFIREVLRMYPIANVAVARTCTKPTTINGINFEVGQTVTVDVMSIHYDPDIFGPQDPFQFNPDRFSPEIKRNPLAFLSFGLGPRQCIGMKFALIELKMAICKLLLNYELCNDKDFELDIVDRQIRIPNGEVSVIFKKREKA